MLKRKRPDVRPPPSWASASRIQSSESQPEKAIERFEASHAEVMRAIKKARVFDQQRLVKKIQEEKEPDKVKGKRKGKPRRKPQADGESVLNTDLIARLERELAVIKTLDMEITARVHLAHAMSRVKGLVEAPGPLPAHLQVAEVLATRSKAARTEDTHNVTSSLYNKPFVRDAVAKAVKEMCQLFGVSDKKEPLKKDKNKDAKPKEKKEKKEKKAKEDADVEDINYNDDDDDEIERELAKYDAMLGGDDKEGSNDEGESGSGSASDGDDDDDDDAEIAKLRAKYKRALAKGLIADDARDDYSGAEDDEDDFEGFSGGEEEEEEEDEDDDDDDEDDSEEEEEESSESEVEKRPRKRAAASAPAVPGASNFLPSLMGGYLAADADDHSDGYGSDEAHRDERAAAKLLGVVRKNRRGQRARQAIWEKKYKADAKHVIKEKLNPKPVAEKWDAKRGAVDANDQPRWLRRKLAMGSKPAYAGGAGGSAASKPAPAPAPKKNENANKQVTGTLHPSWEAARKAKEAAQTAEFKGTKIVFD